MALQDMLLLEQGEWTASEKHLVKFERRRGGWCMDRSYQKSHVGHLREGIELARADGQPGAAADLADERRGAREVVDLDPAIEGVAPPHRPEQHDPGYRGRLAG